MNICKTSKHLKLPKVILTVNSTRLLDYIVKYIFFFSKNNSHKRAARLTRFIPMIIPNIPIQERVPFAQEYGP